MTDTPTAEEPKLTLLPDPHKTQVGITGKATAENPAEAEYHKQSRKALMEFLNRNGAEPWDLTQVQNRIQTIREMDEIVGLHGWMDSQQCVSDIAFAQSIGKRVRQMNVRFMKAPDGGMQVQVADGPDAPSIAEIVKFVGNMNPVADEQEEPKS